MADTTGKNSPKDSKHFLLRLGPPFDTLEFIQEHFEIEFENTSDASLIEPIEEIQDQETVKAYFGGQIGKAVILSESQAASITEYADRHRAVYSLEITELDHQQFEELLISALDLKFPLCIFLSEAQSQWLHSSNSSGSTQRPARITGFRNVGDTYGSYIEKTSPSTTAFVREDNEKDRRKLRPAQDVLNRLRHDSALDEDDYRVVYEDRFRGEVTLDLAQWASDTTEEEFIPQHRILRFERKWDGIAVWDRARRTDMLFGGGSDQHASSSAAEMSGWAISVAGRAELDKCGEVLKARGPGRFKKAVLELTDQGGMAKGLVFST